MPVTLGVFAHVDAGKTTFSEALLYQAKALDRPGRVDHQTTLLDNHALEKKRGITIFSGIACFSFNGRQYQLLDTPGHVDFSAETERALSVLDAAILLLSATDGVQSHTLTLYRLLREKGIPTYGFLNKTDLAGADIPACLADMAGRLTPHILFVPGLPHLDREETVEQLCTYDDLLLEEYLEGRATPAFIRQRLGAMVKAGQILPVCAGSALQLNGTDTLINLVSQTLPPCEPSSAPFGARVFKVQYDDKGNRVAFLKCTGGSLTLKQEVTYGQQREKIHEIRFYHGRGYRTATTVQAGQIAGVTGLSFARAGMGLGCCPDLPQPTLQPALAASVTAPGTPHHQLMAALRRLEAQDPMLEVEYLPALEETRLRIMGRVQLEILGELLKQEGISAAFGPCRVLYRETISAPVMGYGHFEPLRHYAEVHLRLEPNPGGGLAFASECHTDALPRQHQNLIAHHLLTRDHKGVLTGSSLSDVRFVLTAGAFHLKHTEGGDFREAAWRAVRQGLEKAASIVLEPFYRFVIHIPTPLTGRVLTDITRLHGQFDPPEALGGQTRVTGRGPVSTFLSYSEELLSFSGGKGAVSLSFLGYFPCHNQQEVVAQKGYQRDRDLENPSSSVFCAKGAGFEVKWQEAEGYMHLL